MTWTLTNGVYSSDEFRIKQNAAGTFSIISVKRGFITIADTLDEAKKKAEKYGK